jgi:hypothetical protein
MSLSNPYKTGPAFKNSFNVDSTGLTQGDAQDDPAIRLLLTAGIIADDVVGSLWGGLALNASIPQSKNNALGAVIRPATATNCNSFCVFNQANHGVITPNNGVPVYQATNGIHYYRIGSGARIPLPISPEVAALADGTTAIDGHTFAWDPATKRIDVATSGGMAIKLLSVSMSGNMAADEDSTTKNVNWIDAPLGLFQI